MSNHFYGIRLKIGNAGDVYVRGPTQDAGTAIEGGELIPVAAGSLAAFVPTYIASGETFTVPAFRQALWAVPIVIDGTLVLDGVLVPVN